MGGSQIKDVDQLKAKMKEISDHIVRDVRRAGYEPGSPDLAAVCDRIQFVYRNSLLKVDEEILKGLPKDKDFAIRLSLSENPELESRMVDLKGSGISHSEGKQLKQLTKEGICKLVLDYYRKKVEISARLQHLAEMGCVESFRLINANYGPMVANASKEVQKEAKKRYDDLKSAVLDYYNDLLKSAESLTQEHENKVGIEALRELESKLVRDTFGKKYKHCCQKIMDMRDFMWAIKREGASTFLVNPFAEENKRPSSEGLPKLENLSPKGKDYGTRCKTGPSLSETEEFVPFDDKEFVEILRGKVQEVKS